MNNVKDYMGSGGQWVPRLERGSSSKHQAIFDALVADIANGQLRLGDRLPPQRAIAAALGVDLTTVTKAFSKARTDGIIRATTGRGSFVAIGAVDESRGPYANFVSHDLSRNSPPRLAKIDQALAKEVDTALSLGTLAGVLNYQDTGGNWANRAAGANWLAKRQIASSPERIVLTSGAQSALFAVCHLVTKKSNHVCVGRFAYPGIHTVAFQQRLQLVPLAMDGEGISPEAFEDACQRAPIAALYITPTLDNPTTATLPSDRRQQIARIARQYSVAVIEDDPYHDLIPGAPSPIAAIAPDVTWYVATLSKCLSPALRLGFVSVPSAEASTQIAATLQAMTMMASPLFASIASRWIYSGFLREAADELMHENEERQKIAARLLYDQQYETNRHGSHLWLKLPEPWRATDFTNQCERLGVITLGSSSLSVNSPFVEAVRISVGAASSQESLRDALTILRSVIVGGQSNANRAMV
ncbi:DNA-binding transcriptional MocR family regulator [Neorhizobium galegae]|uniref:aminotransferase-like domain-containing protein n=1 Tax=Neorhizobium galegae TaxID=399 RepID=UPI001AEAC3C2|nr:PLP-dependent aminotransferase family protein [Neorhizobium galegae]MBP2562496.1 DNA-binding transcriptional MocR family regulator [Neorhizobium galegae]